MCMQICSGGTASVGAGGPVPEMHKGGGAFLTATMRTTVLGPSATTALGGA